MKNNSVPSVKQEKWRQKFVFLPTAQKNEFTFVQKIHIFLFFPPQEVSLFKEKTEDWNENIIIYTKDIFLVLTLIYFTCYNKWIFASIFF